LKRNRLITDAFIACRAQLARTVSRIVPPHDIEDIVQETYVRVCQYEAKDALDEPRALMTRIARNLALDHIKRAEYRLTSSYEEDDVSLFSAAVAKRIADDTSDTAATREEFSRFCEVVRELPQQCRRVFVMKKVYGYSQREIAQELGLSESTVEKHIARGMLKCTQLLLQRDTVATAPRSGQQQRRSGE
jgi:RNA polymerase sigma-70 factor (ECF subfamily)